MTIINLVRKAVTQFSHLRAWGMPHYIRGPWYMTPDRELVMPYITHRSDLEHSLTFTPRLVNHSGVSKQSDIGTIFSVLNQKEFTGAFAYAIGMAEDINRMMDQKPGYKRISDRQAKKIIGELIIQKNGDLDYMSGSLAGGFKTKVTSVRRDKNMGVRENELAGIQARLQLS